jgi:hypothetical protein
MINPSWRHAKIPVGSCSTSTKADRLKEQLAAFEASELSEEQIEEITRVGSTKPERYFPHVVIEEQPKPTSSGSNKKGGLPLSSTLLLIAMFLFLAPLALASPSPAARMGLASTLSKRDGEGYMDPAAGGGSMVTVSRSSLLWQFRQIADTDTHCSRSPRTPILPV